ncbi:hypothetical protein [Trichoderma harzianum bipartite mycovirus 1]|uniref:Uncharacterized protein n=1 Tax=Trichoderma harzianum bipartite mycovirus 1 TaxID=2315392 RepID=A0A346THI6_9VIRU|nr:hypothetical protein [Trichoderma harzianum bipartite mycovirus 1]AXU24204.1 hypothetical protein [Trichoderma harzianum bipartite mycovirus 1]
MAAQPQPSLLAQFGGANTNIDFSADPNRLAAALPIPEMGDSFEELQRKLRALAHVVEQGRSVAVATGYKAAAQQERDPREIARMAMTPVEIMQLDAWETGAALPKMDWGKDQGEPPQGDASRATALRRAAALNRLYKTDKATVENSTYFVKNYSPLIPLLTAVTKIIGAQRDLVGGMEELDEMQMAEIQTIGKIVATAQTNINRIQEEVRRLLRDINYSNSVLLARSHALKELIPKYKKKKDPVNDARLAVGRPAIGRSFDYRSKAAGAREDRTNFLRGTGLVAGRAGPYPREAKRVRTQSPNPPAEEGEPMAQ